MTAVNILFVIVFIVLGALYLKIGFILDRDIPFSKKFKWFALYTVFTFSLFAVTVGQSVIIKDLREELDKKTPKLEKVENVYRIVE